MKKKNLTLKQMNIQYFFATLIFYSHWKLKYKVIIFRSFHLSSEHKIFMWVKISKQKNKKQTCISVQKVQDPHTVFGKLFFILWNIKYSKMFIMDIIVNIQTFYLDFSIVFPLIWKEICFVIFILLMQWAVLFASV